MNEREDSGLSGLNDRAPVALTATHALSSGRHNWTGWRPLAVLAALTAACLLAAILALAPDGHQAAPALGGLRAPAGDASLFPEQDTHSLKRMVCDATGPFCPALKTVYYAVRQLGSLSHWLPFLAAFGIAYLAFMLVGLLRGRFSPAQGLSFIFPRSVFLHRSAILDYKFYLSRLVTDPIVSLFTLVVSVALVTTCVIGGLTELFGSPRLFAGGALPGLLYTVGLLLAVDFGFYAVHYLNHRVPVLWEFHKVHHACEVLVPASQRRSHPVDRILGNFAFALTAGSVNGVYSWAGHGGLDPITIPGTIAILFLYRFTSVYKHSHIWVSYGPYLSYLINTPAQHQVHHSSEPQHRNRNFGHAFAIWDWMFGTLYLADRRETFPMGLLDEEHLEYRSVTDCYLLPFVKAARVFRCRAKKAGCQESEWGG